MVPRSIAYREFNRRLVNYHDYANVCTTLTYHHHVYQALHVDRITDPLSEHGLVLAINAYVRHWGNMTRHLGSSSNIASPMKRALRTYRRTIQNLDRASARTESANLEIISELFDRICAVRFVLKGKSKRFGPTAAGKLLHMLIPKTCIMWDKETVRDPWHLKGEGEGYVQYLSEKWQEFDAIIEDFSMEPSSKGNRVFEVRTIHSHYLDSIGFKGVSEPITKLLDEANYR